MIGAHAGNPSRLAYASEQAAYAIAACRIAQANRRAARRASDWKAAQCHAEADAQEASVIRTADFLIAFATAHAGGAL